MKKKTKSKLIKKPSKPKVMKKSGVMKKFMNSLSKVMKKNQKKTVSKVKAPQRKVSKLPKKQAKVLSIQKFSKKTKMDKNKRFHKNIKSAPSKVSSQKSLKKETSKKVYKTQELQTKKSSGKVLKAAKNVFTKKNVKTDIVPTEIQPQGFTHEPVLVHEVLESLQLSNKKIVVDGTLGLGGHAKRILENMPAEGKLIGFDVDDDNLAKAAENLKSFGDRAVFVRSNFSNLKEELHKLGIKNVDAILLDLGLSSPQVDNPEKGFSFLREGPLDMRFDKNQMLTAAEVVNTYPQTALMKIFFEYGEESFARKISTEIVRQRKIRLFKTTTDLANFIEKMIGRKGHIHPATRVFQALRIEVNHELDVLTSILQQAVQVLGKHGRLAVIAYHSLEDRAVKHFFKECALDFINEPDKLTTTHLTPTLHIVTKKPIVPSDTEISKNPRSRSAKLRVAEKI